MFLKPHKYTKINQSVLGVSADIIRVLVDKKEVSFSEVQKVIIEKRGQSVRDNFLLSLCFLFSLGKIDYASTSDSILLTRN